jgi:hypothetical protein
VQLPTAIPREGLTEAEVVAVIRDDAGVRTSAGLEVIGMDLLSIEDITDVFAGQGKVTRGSYDTIHAKADLTLEAELDWGGVLLRPYMLFHRTQGEPVRFNLGAYFPVVPGWDVEELPQVYAMEGFDILDRLADPVGESYSVVEGTSYVGAVEQILTELGYVRFSISAEYASSTLPSTRSWAIDPNLTWLTIVNDLLNAIAYEGIWSDWDGRLISNPYRSPRERASEWTYDSLPLTSMIARKRRLETDFYRAPNRWVFYRTNDVDGAVPVEGDGIFTFINESNGPTSVEARNNRVLSKVLGLEAADHDALVRQGEQIIAEDLLPKTRIPVSTAPNPLHWHFDRCTIADEALGPVYEVLDTRWSLPLSGEDMTHEFTLI